MMMWVYSAGFVAMMAVYALLYWNQYRRRDALGLSEEQAFTATHRGANAFVECAGWAGVSRCWR